MDSATLDLKSVDEPNEVGPVPLPFITKSSIIDRELHKHGMRRYQWLIWAICGLGFFLDIMWAQSLGLVSSSVQHEFGFTDKELGNMGSAFLAGMTVGAFTWGSLVDVVGRRVAFLGTSLIAGVFGMCLGAMTSYYGLLGMMVCTGFGIGGNIPIDSTITVEYLPQDRFYLLAALAIYVPIGATVSTLIAFAFIPNYSCSTNLVSCRLVEGAASCCSRDSNMGWRYLFFTVAAITLAVFVVRFFIFPFYESPKFLLSKGNDRGAVEVVRKIAEFNGCSCDLTVESLYSQCDETPVKKEIGASKRLANEFSRLRLLFGSWRMIRVTIIVWVTWIFYSWGQSVAATFLPIILQRKNNAINVGLRQTFVDYLIIYPPGIVANALSVLMVRAPTVGRKWTLVLSSVIMGISLFLYSLVNTQASHVGLNMLEYFVQCLFGSALYGWTPEAFPVSVRGTATGLASSFSYLFAISGPLIGEKLFSSTNGSNAVLYLSGAYLLVCTVCLLCLRTKDMIAPR